VLRVFRRTYLCKVALQLSQICTGESFMQAARATSMVVVISDRLAVSVCGLWC